MAELLAIYGDSIKVGWFEWSTPPKALRTDRTAWAQANPAMNHTECVADCVTDRAVAHALVSDPADVFDCEVMCRQIDTASGGPFPPDAWVNTIDDLANDAVEKDARPAVCVEISAERSAAFIAKAARDRNGCAVVGIVEALPGTDGVEQWLAQHRREYKGVVVRCGAGSPNLALHADLVGDDKDRPKYPVIDWKSTDVTQAWQDIYDKVRDSAIALADDGNAALKHLSHPGLDTAACTAVIRMQPGGAWIVDGLKSPHDVAPLYAAAGAVWGLDFLPDDGPSIYAGEHGVEVLVI
jgi:hypothetical protein